MLPKNHDRRFWLLFNTDKPTYWIFSADDNANESAPYLWSIFLGCGLGGCFSMMMIAALDHVPHPLHAGALSALMQGGGFIIASFGPLIAVWLQQDDGSFTYAWAFSCCLSDINYGIILHG